MIYNKEKDICNIFLDLGKEIPKEIANFGGFNLWHLSRRKIFYKYRAKCFQNQFKFKLTKEKKQNLKSVKLIFNEIFYFFYCIFSHLQRFFTLKKVDQIIFTNERFINYKNQIIFPYTYSLENQLLKNKISFIKIHQTKDRKIPRKHSLKCISDASIFKDYFLVLIIKLFAPKFRIKRLAEYIRNEMYANSIDLNKNDIYKILLNTYIRFFCQKIFYSNFFSRTSPLKIYLTCSYSYEGLIGEAKKFNCKVFEMQHSSINETHFGYNLPKDIDTNLIPDEINVFSDFWNNSNLFHPSIKINKFDYKWFLINELDINKFAESSINKKKCLFVSQPSIPGFFNIIEKLALNNPDIEFIFRPHPRELIKNSKNSFFETLNKISNIKISYSSNIFNDLQKVDFIICGKSFAAFEALALNKHVILTSPFLDNPFPELVNYTIFINCHTLESISIKDLDWPNKKIENNILGDY